MDNNSGKDLDQVNKRESEVLVRDREIGNRYFTFFPVIVDFPGKQSRRE